MAHHPSLTLTQSEARGGSYKAGRLCRLCCACMRMRSAVRLHCMPDRTDPHYGACLLPRTVIIDQAPRPRVRSGPRSQSSTTKNSWGLPDGGLAALHVAACNAMRAPNSDPFEYSSVRACRLAGRSLGRRRRRRAERGPAVASPTYI